MSSVIDRAAIEKLSVEERLKLIDLIWDTLPPEQGNEPMSDELYAEMMRRLKDAKENPDSGMTLEEFKARLQARWNA